MARTEREAAAEEARRRAAQAQIRQYPDPVLREPARPVEAFDEDLAALVARMARLMHDAHGAGLAAPQLGLLRSVLVYQADLESEPTALVNPRIVEASDETVVDGEGCLSLDLLLREQHQIPVERAARIVVQAQDVDGSPVERAAEGMEARVIQHEIDHLAGRLIIDVAEPEARREAMRLLRRRRGPV